MEENYILVAHSSPQGKRLQGESPLMLRLRVHSSSSQFSPGKILRRGFLSLREDTITWLTVLRRGRRTSLQSGGYTHITGMLFKEFPELNLIVATDRSYY